MDGPTDPMRPEAEFRAESMARRGGVPVAMWAIGLMVVAVVAIVGRVVVPTAPVPSAVPAVAELTTASPTSTVPPVPSPQPARIVLVVPRGPIATLVDGALLISGTIGPEITRIDVIVTDIRSNIVGQASLGTFVPVLGEFEANVPISGVGRTEWLFIEVAALDGTGGRLEVVRRAVQVAALDPSA